MLIPRRSRWLGLALGLLGLGLALLGCSSGGPAVGAAGGPAVAAFPAPAVDEPAPARGGTETVVLAGGCFWGVQGVYQHVQGVQRAVSGYAGGTADSARYIAVSAGGTGHAESVEITFDPKQVSYGQLLRIFFSVVHDPTQLDAQGPDTGTQYRSAIFPRTDEQARVAQAYVGQLTAAHVFDAPIVTRIEPSAAFYPAEDYHQDFLNTNPQNPYIAMYDMPKLDALKRGFPELYRDRPALVAAAPN